MRGYFAIGIVGPSKPGNVGNLVRTAHAFGAAFVFTIGVAQGRFMHKFDTAKSETALPVYEYDNFAALQLPKHCRLVGVEMTDEAVNLPSFRHPSQAAYVLGGERASLPPDIVAACDHVVKIPTRFSLNVATAGAIVMYDRQRTLGRYAKPPVTPSGKPLALETHVHGGPISRRGKRS